MIDTTFSIYRQNVEGWRLSPLAHICKEVQQRNLQLNEDNLLSLSYGRIVRKDIETNEGLLPDSFDGYNIVEPGDTVLRLTDLQNDKRSLRTGLVRERGIITSAYTTIRPLGVDARWLSYTLHSYDIQKIFYSLGSGLRQSMKFDDLKSLAVAVPPIEEQRRIADYLDWQVSIIQKLIEEKRGQANLAADAVEANLIGAITSLGSPNYEYKVPWLTNSFERTVLFGRLFKVSLGKMLQPEPKTPSDLLLPYINSVKIGDLSSAPIKRMWVNPKEVRYYQAEDGDLLVMEGGDVGKCAFYEGEPVIIQKSLHRVRATELGHLPYAEAMLNAVTYSKYFNVLGNVATIRHLTLEKLRELPIPFFPLSDQKRLALNFQSNFQETDRKIESIRRSVALLSEMRQALITAAVTGEFDVTTGRSVA